MDDSAWIAELTWGSWFLGLLGAGSIALLLSTAGLYAIMSFTVSKRTREIGVRIALGANRARVAREIFARGLKQVSLGVLIGAGLFGMTGLLMLVELGMEAGPTEIGLFALYLTAMTFVCSLACVIPTRRALAIEPTEALRAEG